MSYSHLDYFQKPPLGSRPNTNPGATALETLTTVDLLYMIMCEDPRK